MTRMQQDIASRANSFFAFGDHQNLRPQVLSIPLGRYDLKYALNYQFLFTDRVYFVAEDLLVNEALVSLLAQQYRPALEDGLFVPLLRDDFDSLADCREYLSAPDFYNQTGAETWQRSIDDLVSIRMDTASFSQEAAYAHFTDVAQRYFSDGELLSGLGLTIPAASIDQGVTSISRQANRAYWRRSAFFAFADKLESAGHRDDARRLRRISSVIYMAHFGGLFNQVSVFPGWYEPYIARMTSIHSISLDSATLNQDDAVSSLELVLPNTRKDDLATLSFNDVLNLRATKEFARYIGTLREAPSTPAGAESVVLGLANYLTAIDNYIADRSLTGRSATERSRRALTLVKRTSDAGTLIGFADVVMSGRLTSDLAINAALGSSALLLLVIDRAVDRRLDSIELRRRNWWNSYCGSDGTFSAQVAKLRGRMPF